MPPKNMKLENTVLYTADGRKVGRIEDFEIEVPVYEHGSEIIGKVQHLDPIEGSFEATLTEEGKKILARMERETAVRWVGVYLISASSHLAQFAKNRRIRKKHADKCVKMFREWLKGGGSRGS